MSFSGFLQCWLLRRISLIFAMLAVCSSSWAQTFEVKGVEDDEVVENIKLYAMQLDPPVSEFDVDNYQAKLLLEVQTAVQAFGYYSAEINFEPIVYRPADQFLVTMNVQLNARVMVKEVSVLNDFALFDEEQLANLPEQITNVLDQLKLMQGQAFEHGKYDTLKNQLIVLASIYGYFDFDFVMHKVLILPATSPQNEQTKAAGIYWIFNLGERYKFGDLVFLNDTRGQDLARKVKPFKRGEYFDQNVIGKYSIDMASIGYFDSAIARANAGDEEQKHVPVEVILRPKPKDQYKVGVGFSTDTGPRISLDWKRPWVNLDGDTLGAKAYISKSLKLVSADYRIPKDNPLNDFLNYRITYQQTRENQTDSDLIGLDIQRQWGAKAANEWDKIGFLSIQQETFTQGSQAEQTVRLVMPGFTFNRTRKRGDIFVDWGDRQQLTVQGASKDVLSDIDFFKLVMKTKWVRQFDSQRLILRGELGAIATNDFSKVPASQRFFTGGDQSVRGFGYNELAEFETVGTGDSKEIELVGGKYLYVASAEYAVDVANSFRASVFVDVGNATKEFGRDIAKSVGVGVHWLSPIGNVRVYLARGKSSLETTFRVHLIIGPSL